MLKINNFLKLLSSVGANKYYVLFLILMMLISSMLDILSLGLIAPYIATIFEVKTIQTNYFFLSLENYDEKEIILYLTIFLITIFFFKTIFSILIRWLISLFAYKQYAILQVKLMNAYQNMGYQDYILRSSSEYIRNIRELGGECLNSIDSTLRVLSELIIFAAIIIFLGLVNFKILFFLIFAILPIFIVYEKLFKPINVKLGHLKADALKQMYKNIDTGIRGLKEMRILERQKFFLDKIDYYAQKIYKAEKISILINDSPRYIFEFFIITLSLIVFLILSKQSLDFSSFLPALGVFMLAALRLLPSLASITSNLNRIGYGRYAVEKVSEDLEKFSIKKTYKRNSLERIDDKLTNFENLKMKNISFKYKNSDIEVFNNINFDLEKNDCIGIIGESGSGKTTFVDMMLGLLQPTNGKMYLNDQYIEKFSSNLINKIAYLPQEPIILDEKIKKNISLEINENLININKINQALLRSNFKKVLNNLPQGFETVIGDGGIRLSGGQNKRLALARAFYHGKNIIIMDEATSSLDLETENYIADQIKELKGKITIIIISHQLNILKYCNKIYKVDNKNINLVKNN